MHSLSMEAAAAACMGIRATEVAVYWSQAGGMFPGRGSDIQFCSSSVIRSLRGLNWMDGSTPIYKPLSMQEFSLLHPVHAGYTFRQNVP